MKTTAPPVERTAPAQHAVQDVGGDAPGRQTRSFRLDGGLDHRASNRARAAASMLTPKDRERTAVHKKRPDGRRENEIRPITIETDVAPRSHGSA